MSLNSKDKVFVHPKDAPYNIKEKLYENLSSKEEANYKKVLEYFSDSGLKLGVKENAGEKDNELGLSSIEKMWLSRDCMMRYLRACNLDVDETIKRLKSSIVWRRSFGISNGIYGEEFLKNLGIFEIINHENVIKPEVVKGENETGKQLIFGYDKENRPLLYLFNEKENTEGSHRQVEFLIFMLEIIIDYMPLNVDKLGLCVDFKKFPGVGLKKKKNPSVKLMKEILSILQYHYPERLGLAAFYEIPILVNVLLKICYPFVDPYTKKKCHFGEEFGEFIGSDQLITLYKGGSVDFEYNHEIYWEALIKNGQSKKRLQYRNFNRLGGKIGLTEFDLKAETPERLSININSTMKANPDQIFEKEYEVVEGEVTAAR
ncbi:CRAL-TRIO domain-containing protein [Ascoidea rubescens DSM 1968]|uniref:Phosphatidylinositol transfer protein n=1 Tax=Ascoidea rubescens DSM 1968 TaxID=1344418 RepID=A0A1D2VKM6_9ASCO|nr:phosphatidylinositol transfer protein [Ascoidea rubescens DSM 1968]ODV62145.1 phosphatidylinositol transfer protein [Ascoidea rubescens DSM 1968]